MSRLLLQTVNQLHPHRSFNRCSRSTLLPIQRTKLPISVTLDSVRILLATQNLTHGLNRAIRLAVPQLPLPPCGCCFHLRSVLEVFSRSTWPSTPSPQNSMETIGARRLNCQQRTLSSITDEACSLSTTTSQELASAASGLPSQTVEASLWTTA
jgi:hypothetical protein